MTYIQITDAEIAANQPVTRSLIARLRDNILAAIGIDGTATSLPGTLGTNRTIITATGAFTFTPLKTGWYKIRLVAGGGGGGGRYAAGGDGGSSTFAGRTVTGGKGSTNAGGYATSGLGGNNAAGVPIGGTGNESDGIGSGGVGDFGIHKGPHGTRIGEFDGHYGAGGWIGEPGYPTAGTAQDGRGTGGVGYGAGGAGGGNPYQANCGSGGGGGVDEFMVQLTAGVAYSGTCGAAGAAGATVGGAQPGGGNGAPGVVIIEWVV